MPLPGSGPSTAAFCAVPAGTGVLPAGSVFGVSVAFVAAVAAAVFIATIWATGSDASIGPSFDASGACALLCAAGAASRAAFWGSLEAAGFAVTASCAMSLGWIISFKSSGSMPMLFSLNRPVMASRIMKTGRPSFSRPDSFSEMLFCSFSIRMLTVMIFSWRFFVSAFASFSFSSAAHFSPTAAFNTPPTCQRSCSAALFFAGSAAVFSRCSMPANSLLMVFSFSENSFNFAAAAFSLVFAFSNGAVSASLSPTFFNISSSRIPFSRANSASRFWPAASRIFWVISPSSVFFRSMSVFISLICAASLSILSSTSQRCFSISLRRSSMAHNFCLRFFSCAESSFRPDLAFSAASRASISRSWLSTAARSPLLIRAISLSRAVIFRSSGAFNPGKPTSWLLR